MEGDSLKEYIDKTKSNFSFFNALSYICVFVLFITGQFAIFSFVAPILVNMFVPEKYKTEEFSHNTKQAFNYSLTVIIGSIALFFICLYVFCLFLLLGIFETTSTLLLVLCFSLFFFIGLLSLGFTVYYFFALIVAICKSINNEKVKIPLVIRFWR